MNAITPVDMPHVPGHVPGHVPCHTRDLLRDPLTRLMMASDGVSERELLELLRRVRRARFPRAGLAPVAHPGPDPRR